MPLEFFYFGCFPARNKLVVRQSEKYSLYIVYAALIFFCRRRALRAPLQKRVAAPAVPAILSSVLFVRQTFSALFTRTFRCENTIDTITQNTDKSSENQKIAETCKFAIYCNAPKIAHKKNKIAVWCTVPKLHRKNRVRYNWL
jgi:hypothetical protein